MTDNPSLNDFARDVVAPAVSEDTEVTVNGQPVNPLGPQSGPSSVPKIEAEVKRTEQDLNALVDERILHMAARKYCKTKQVPEDYARQQLLSNPALLDEWAKK